MTCSTHRLSTLAVLGITGLALAAACAQPARAAGSAIGDPSSNNASNKGSLSASIGPLGLSLGLAEFNGPGEFSARVLLHSGSLRALKHDDVGLQGNQYDLRQRMGPGISLLGDWRPWRDSGWRMTGGLLLSRVNTQLTGRPDGAGNVNLNGHAYNSAQIGTLSGRMRYKPLSLYLGGGWESKAQGEPGWRFVSDLGLLMTARPSVTLSSSSGSGNAALQQDLAAEQRELRRYGVGVLGSIGVAYGF